MNTSISFTLKLKCICFTYFCSEKDDATGDLEDVSIHFSTNIA